MRFRAQLVNAAAFTKLVDSVSKLTRRVVFRFDRQTLKIISTGDDEDGLRLYGTIIIAELFGSNYHIESNFENSIALEFSTQALASAIRQTSSSPTEIIIRLGRMEKTPFLSLTATTVGRGGAEYEVDQRVAVRVLKPGDVEALPEPICPVPDVHISLPKLSDVCKVAERLKSLSDLIKVSASRLGGFRLGISTEHAQVETEWRGLTVYQRTADEAIQEEDTRTPRPHSAFYQATVKSRGLLRFFHAHVTGQVSLASICEGHCLILFNYIGDSNRLIATENQEGMTGSLIAFLPAVNEEGDS